MPQPRSTTRGTLTRLVLFAVLGWALYALRRDGAEDTIHQAEEAAPTDERPAVEDTTPVAPTRPRVRGRRRRFATSLAFATLFFAGAALSAGAGDAIVEAMEADTAATCETAGPEADPAAQTACPEESTEAASDEATGGGESEEPAEEPGETEPAPEEETGEPASDDEPAADDTTTEPEENAGEGAEDPADDGAAEEGSGEPSSHDDGKGQGNDGAATEVAGPPVLAPQHDHDHETTELDPEADAFGSFATVWLHRTLPDPMPPTKRLAPAFAKQLLAESKRARVDWAMVLAVLRADGYGGQAPATRQHIRSLARDLRSLLNANDEWQALLAYHGRTAFADRAMALTYYNRAVGLDPLVRGFEPAREQIAARVLADSRLQIYGAGRGDIEAGRIDVRVMVLMRYLAEAYGSVTVSSLQSGHRLYSRPGVVSAHIYGLAVDVAALGGQSITGNSAPGGLTEEAVRDILLLPAELRPRQVISLLGLGGPSFPMANHYDHIHVGF